ncbi:MAG: TRAP transporter small permease [Thiolinea sp.]
MAKHFFQLSRAVLEYLLMFCLFAMVVINFADVMGRHLFNHPIYGIHDLTEHLMALVVFCGLPLVTIAGTHLAVDLLDKFLQSPAMRWWQHVIVLLIVTILLLVAWTFLQSALEAGEISDVSNELRLPRGPLYLFMIASALLSVLGLLYQHFLADETLIELADQGGDL